jgi:hypothetical protein
MEAGRLMSDQSLRDALEKLADELDSHNTVLVAGRALRELLAAHPAEPARPLLDRDAVFRFLHQSSLCACDGTMGWAFDSQPHRKHIEHYERLTDGAMRLARPMPSREQIAAVIADELDGEGVVSHGLTPKLTARVMDLLNGTES